METLLYTYLSHKDLLMQIKPKTWAVLHLRMNENPNSRCLLDVDLLLTAGYWECAPLPSTNWCGTGPGALWFSHGEQRWAGSCVVKHMFGALSFYNPCLGGEMKNSFSVIV